MTARNTHAMPYLMPVDRFAARAVGIIERGTRYAVLPWQMAWLARLMRIAPDGIYDALGSRAFATERRRAKP
jgi:hypothetical protein